jgi:hypothetical protein
MSADHPVLAEGSALTVRYLSGSDGASPAEEFFRSLNEKTRGRFLSVVDQFAATGVILNVKNGHMLKGN